MKKLTLLLIPLLFLSSCSIDWNGEKDKKIAELEQQVTDLKTKNDKVSLNFENLTYNKVNSDSRLLKCT